MEFIIIILFINILLFIIIMIKELYLFLYRKFLKCEDIPINKSFHKLINEIYKKEKE